MQVSLYICEYALNFFLFVKSPENISENHFYLTYQSHDVIFKIRIAVKFSQRLAIQDLQAMAKSKLIFEALFCFSILKLVNLFIYLYVIRK